MRRFAIEIDGKPFIKHGTGIESRGRDFRVTFRCNNSYTYCLGLLDLAIYNLSNQTQIKMGAKITLKAGYDEQIDSIFTGCIMSVLKEREGPNIITRLICRSGEMPKFDAQGQELRPVINKSFGKGTGVLTLIQAVGDAWGKPISKQDEQFSDVQPLARMRPLCGDVKAVMDALAEEFKFSWCLVQDKIVIDRKDSPRKGDAYLLNFRTGLIGVPEMADENVGDFVDMTSCLAPSLRLGGLVKLESKYASYNTGNMYFRPPTNGGDLSGVYRIMELTHEGDSWGSPWQTHIKGMLNGR